MRLHHAYVASPRSADHFDDFALELLARFLRVDQNLYTVSAKRKASASLPNVEVVQAWSAHHIGGSARGEFNGARCIGHVHFKSKSVAFGGYLLGPV